MFAGFVIFVTAGSCSTAQVNPLPEIPATPPGYVRVPHPDGTDMGDLVAIFTERDALRALAQGTPHDTPVGHLMTVSPVTAHPTTSLASAVRKMAIGGYRRLPVLDDQGRPCGVVTTAGLVHYLVEQFARGIYNLPPQQTGAVPEREGP